MDIFFYDLYKINTIKSKNLSKSPYPNLKFSVSPASLVQYPLFLQTLYFFFKFSANKSTNGKQKAPTRFSKKPHVVPPVSPWSGQPITSEPNQEKNINVSRLKALPWIDQGANWENLKREISGCKNPRDDDDQRLDI